MCLPVSRLFWVSSLAYPNLLGTKGYVVVCLLYTLMMKTVGNDRKTPQLFSTSIFEYENESENGKVGHENECELTENRE
jgi:hypothetical protein